MRVYLDSPPVIDVVENVPGLAEAVDRRLLAAGVVRVTSDLARLECRLAAAFVSRCDIFLTNDRPLARFSDIAVEIVSAPNADYEATPP